MKQVLLTFLALALLLPAAAYAQKPSEANPISNGIRGFLARESRITIGAVENMPADKFSYRPTPAQWTFGHLVLHMIQSNYFMCSGMSGVKAHGMPSVKDTDPKATLLAGLKTSFNFCSESLKHLNDSMLTQRVPFFGGRTITRGALIINAAEDYGNHYAQASIYLRLNGHLPPTAQHGPMGKMGKMKKKKM